MWVYRRSTEESRWGTEGIQGVHGPERVQRESREGVQKGSRGGPEGVQKGSKVGSPTRVEGIAYCVLHACVCAVYVRVCGVCACAYKLVARFESDGDTRPSPVHTPNTVVQTDPVDPL